MNIPSNFEALLWLFLSALAVGGGWTLGCRLGGWSPPAKKAS